MPDTRAVVNPSEGDFDDWPGNLTPGERIVAYCRTHRTPLVRSRWRFSSRGPDHAVLICGPCLDRGLGPCVVLDSRRVGHG